MSISVKYLIIGAGPAGICAAIKLLQSGVIKNQITIVDPSFTVGAFGTVLSTGSSVPGNTAVSSYKKVYHEIQSVLVKQLPILAEEKQNFKLNTFEDRVTCSLKDAAEPLQYYTNQLRKLIRCLEGKLLSISSFNNQLRGTIQLNTGAICTLVAERIILATGSEPKTFALPIPIVDPNIAFIYSELKNFLETNNNIQHIGVIGSSHSAALAVMHLLQAGVRVTRLKKKPYLFAKQVLAADGTVYTKYDNVGLKGDVAIFTNKLLNDSETKQRYHEMYRETIDINDILTCCCAVMCIGYSPVSSIEINNKSQSLFTQDIHTSQILDDNQQPVFGLYGIGIAYPLQVVSKSGEVELAVGVGKFWSMLNKKILKIWDDSLVKQC